MTAEQKIAVLERMRELLADPDRVVLDPFHYFEVENGAVREVSFESALLKRETCRVCFCGAATMAAFEVAGIGLESPEYFSAQRQLRGLLGAKVDHLGIPLDGAVSARYGDGTVAALTSALKQGRAVEVVDACLADLRSAA